MARLKPWLRITGIIVGAFIVVMGGLFLLRHPILRGLGGLLTHVDPIEQSDVIVILSGGEDTRPFYAADLFGAGVAQRIILSQEEPTPTARLGLTPPATDVAIHVLRSKGIPEDAIQLIATGQPVTSTREEAAALRDFLVSDGARKVTVVTSPFHTARARFTLDRVLEGTAIEIRMAAAPEWLYDPDRWWENETGISQYGMEVLKWIHTLAILQ